MYVNIIKRISRQKAPRSSFAINVIVGSGLISYDSRNRKESRPDGTGKVMAKPENADSLILFNLVLEEMPEGSGE